MPSMTKLASSVAVKVTLSRTAPWSQQDNMALKSKYTKHRTDNNSNSGTDKVMEPLTRLFADLVGQSKLLTSPGHSPHNSPYNYEGNGRHGHQQRGFHNSQHGNGNRQHGNGNYHRQIMPRRTTASPSPSDQFQMEWTS